MNDKARLKFLDRLGRSASLTVSEAAFIESLADADVLSDAQRQRVDDLHARHRARMEQRKPAVKRDKPVTFNRDADLEARLHACRKGHQPVAGQNSTPGAPWQCWCACGGLTQPTPESLVAQWNLLHPK